MSSAASGCSPPFIAQSNTASALELVQQAPSWSPTKALMAAVELT